MELSPELRDLLRDNMFAPLRKALAEENILTVESFRTVRPWAFLNEHDLYPMADRQSISLRILKLRDDAVKTPAEEDLNDVPYAKRFSREPALYDAYPITDCGFSVRVLGRLQARGINSVGKLLEQTDSKLLAISGFGRNSINEVHDYLSKLEERSLSKVRTDIKVDATDEVLKYKDRIWAGDFSFVETDNLSTRSRLAVHTLENAYHVLGSDLVTAVREKPDYIKHLKKMLEGFITDVQIVSACEGIIQKIPTSRRDIDAKTVIKAYTANTETQSSLLVNYSEGASLRQFIFSNGEAIANQDAKLMRFLKWCEYDVKTELTEQLRLTIKTDQMRTVLYGRARGATLAELGDQLGVTRERIRQIEAKIYRHLKDWFKRHRINQKIFLDLEESIALPADRIAEYVGEIGTEVVYLLKEYAEEDYSYLPQNDLFLLGEKDCFTKVQEEINQLPEIVTADSMDQLISQTAESTGFPEKLIRIIVNKDYQRTGDTYHRSRLSLTSMYYEVLRKYYPHGIHIDEESIDRFRSQVESEYGIDMSDKRFHAIASILGRIGILCARGRYIAKDDAVQLSDSLKQKIKDYVESRSVPVTLFSSIFTEFEEELRIEGVDNRFYLQGILRDLFSDKWYFRKDYVSTDAEVTSFYETLGSFIAKATSPVTKDDLKRKFPGITDIVINLSLDNPEIINLFGAYIHVSRLTLTDEDIQYFHQKVEKTLSTQELCYVRDLYPELLQECPGLLTRNYITSGFCLYSVLEYLFGEEYNFSRPFIAREGSEIKSIHSVLREMVEDSETIALSEVLAFASEHHYSIAGILDFADLCNGTHLLINDDELASIDYIGVNEETAQTIEKLILAEIHEATPIAHLECINQFPKLNVEWNAWLIYSILHKWSKLLDVGPSKYPYRIAYPVVAPAGMPLVVEYDERISHNGDLIMPDNLDNIEELIANYVLEELGGSDEV